jgi:hypothetical protein
MKGTKKEKVVLFCKQVVLSQWNNKHVIITKLEIISVLVQLVLWITLSQTITFPREIGSLYQKRLEICVSTRK